MIEPFEKAFYLLFQVLGIYLVFTFARHLASNSTGPKWKAFGWAVFVSIGLAFLGWANYGTRIENSDPLYGGGETVIDLEPSDQERNHHGLFLFTILVVPTLLGVGFGIKDRPIHQKAKSRTSLPTNLSVGSKIDYSQANELSEQGHQEWLKKHGLIESKPESK